MKRQGAESAHRWLLLLLGVACAAPAAWAADPRLAAFESGLRPAVEVNGATTIRWSLAERMAHYKVPGVSIAVIRQGDVAWARGYGLLAAGGKQAVDTDTVFSVGSLSKVGAAVVTLRLVDDGQLELDRNVNDYLARWQVSANAYVAAQPVTLRGLLSHTAGLTVSGFPDFAPGEALPDILDVLEGRPPAKTGPVIANYVPGTRARYSGGGVTVEQLVIEDVTGLSFEAAARRELFEPLGMHRSTYVNPLPASIGNIARAHGRDGLPRALPRGWEAMPEAAASGLWTTPRDYARLVIALLDAWRGTPGALLSQELAREMMTEVGPSSFGLGPEMQGRGMQRLFSHSGANESYRAWMEGHLVTGNGAVIFTNGANGSLLRDEIRRAIAHAEGWPVARAITVPDLDLPVATLRPYTGVYVVQPASTLTELRAPEQAAAFTATLHDDRLQLGVPGTPDPLQLVAEGTNRFVDSARGHSHVEFVHDYTGQVSALRLHEGGGIVEARRVQRPE